MSTKTTITLPVAGMDCASCAAHIEQAVNKLPGVEGVQVLVAAERATVIYDPQQLGREQIVGAVGQAGYSVPDDTQTEVIEAHAPSERTVSSIIGWGVLGVVALVVVVASLGEQLGLLDAVVERLPWWIPGVAVAIGGYRVFKGVLQAALRRQVTSHTLMSVGVPVVVLIPRLGTNLTFYVFALILVVLGSLGIRRCAALVAIPAVLVLAILRLGLPCMRGPFCPSCTSGYVPESSCDYSHG